MFGLWSSFCANLGLRPAHALLDLLDDLGRCVDVGLGAYPAFGVSVEQGEQHAAFSGCEGRVGGEQAVAEQLFSVKPSQDAHDEAQALAVDRTTSGQIRKALDTVVSPKQKLTNPIKKPKATWVEPMFYAEVEYRDITSEGLLRASSFKGLSKGTRGS
ncbi:hypothetical protein [Bradyrhizobium japonicum]|uniref:ATP dependent DNA ligase n=1 Tax=Bradyrhizobium japonicum TaxID=375 RepID=UPI003F73AE66